MEEKTWDQLLRALLAKEAVGVRLTPLSLEEVETGAPPQLLAVLAEGVNMAPPPQAVLNVSLKDKAEKACSSEPV